MLRTVHRLFARQLQEQLPASPGAGDYVSMGKAVWLPLCSQLWRAHERVHMKGQGLIGSHSWLIMKGLTQVGGGSLRQALAGPKRTF